MLNFIATDLQLYMIFKITRVSFSGTQYTNTYRQSYTYVFQHKHFT